MSYVVDMIFFVIAGAIIGSIATIVVQRIRWPMHLRKRFEAPSVPIDFDVWNPINAKALKNNGNEWLEPNGSEFYIVRPIGGNVDEYYR